MEPCPNLHKTRANGGMQTGFFYTEKKPKRDTVSENLNTVGIESGIIERIYRTHLTGKPPICIHVQMHIPTTRKKMSQSGVHYSLFPNAGTSEKLCM